MTAVVSKTIENTGQIQHNFALLTCTESLRGKCLSFGLKYVLISSWSRSIL